MSSTLPASRRAFTLIEVLIGVLILALGVLGLGAIIPVIVREQRQAADVTLGAAAAGAAMGDLVAKPGFDPKSSEQTVWDALLDNATAANNRWSKDGQWGDWSIGGTRTLHTRYYTSPTTREDTNWSATFDEDNGQMSWTAAVTPQTFNPATNAWVNSPIQNRYYALPVASRLWPGAATQTVDQTAPDTDPYRPQFVWDIVARRVPVAAGEAPRLQVALFVRRIDLNIRLPRGLRAGGRTVTLLDVLTDWTNVITTDQERCVPVAMDSPTSTSSQARTNSCGVPTNRGTADGTRYYASPIYVAAEYDITQPDRLYFPNLTGGTNSSDRRWQLISQVGQKIVDNLGNIYSVRGPVDDTTATLYIDPAVPGWVPDRTAQDPAGLPGLNPAKINQVVFTPQVPAAVQVFNITRPLNY